MENLLVGLPFQRIAAVDARTVAGLERRDFSRPMSRDSISRYDKACTMIHRKTWEDFLASNEKYACILEDDIYISPEFQRFVTDESWIPKDANLVKLETTGHRVLITRSTQKCLSRSAAILHSIHYGTAAYIVSRQAAADLLEQTQTLDLTADFAVFNEAATRRYYPIYQICPALCIQGTNLKDGVAFDEMKSTSKPSQISERKTIAMKIRMEITRPFLQLKKTSTIFFKQLWFKAQRVPVPFA